MSRPNNHWLEQSLSLKLLLQVRALLVLSWLSLGRANEIVGGNGVGVQGPVVQGGTWALGTFLGGILGVAGSLGESHVQHSLLKTSNPQPNKRVT